MLKELARLSTDLLFMHGHIAVFQPARRPTRSDAMPGAEPSPGARRRRRRGAAEWLTLTPIWVLTPVIVSLAIAELVRLA